jgi:hypothetical protein
MKAIEADRRLLDDDGLGVWLGAVLDGGATTSLCLRWAAGLTDHAVRALAERPDWAGQLRRLDLGFCDRIGDGGVLALGVAAPQLEQLSISGCRRVGDDGLQSIGRCLRQLTALELQLLPQITGALACGHVC